MYFHEAEIVELGQAEDLIQDVESLVNSEGSTPSKIKTSTPIYVADME